MARKTPKAKVNPAKGSKTIDSAIEELLEKACNDYKLSVFKTVKAAVDAYKVSYPTLVRRVNVQTCPKSVAHKHQMILIPAEEEEELVDWLNYLAMTGYPVNRRTSVPKLGLPPQEQSLKF
ncbi:hypothetical protein H0H87_008493 [Tephrocybe sp. NHM501043]|nr:hypothetical protein H0H87_008493 [Tephrocybe sp. NHM501043]